MHNCCLIFILSGLSLRIALSPKRGLLLLSFVTVVSICVATVVVLWEQRQRELAHARVETLSIARMLTEQTGQMFGAIDLALQGVQERLGTEFGSQLPLDSLPVQLLLAARSSGVGHIRSVFVVGPEGRLENSSRSTMLGLDVAERDYFRVFAEGRASGLFIDFPVLGRVDGQMILHLARRLEDRQGGFRGVVVVSVSVDEIGQVFEQARLDLPRPIGLYLNGRLIVATDKVAAGDVPERLDDALLRPIKAGEILLQDSPAGGGEHLAVGQVRGLPLIVTVGEQREQVVAEWWEAAKPIAVGAGLVSLLIVWITALLIHQMNRQHILQKALDDALLHDVSERRQAEERLAVMNQQLRTLSSRLQEVREQERAHIARELHDELGQQLTGLKLDFSWLGKRILEGKPVGRDKVDAMRSALDHSIASVRQISAELRPLILDDLGLAEAIAWQSSEIAKRSGLQVDLDVDAAQYVTDPAQATAFFRIVQESLTNIVRHAEARHVEIGLDYDAEAACFKLRVRDDGKGLGEPTERGGIGLISMRERVSELGGSFVIESGEGGGTTLRVVIPEITRVQDGAMS